MKLKKGFTLLEILMVIALIGILASIIIVAINPSRQLAQARNFQREGHIKTINDAINQYASREGEFPPGISNTYQDICPLGGGTNCVNLEVSLIPGYLSSIPTDPSGGNYQVAISAINGKLSIQSPNSELGQTIGTNTFVSGVKYTGFNVGTPVGFNGLVNDIEIQSDGKIVFGGDFTTYQGSSGEGIIRLNSDWSIDNSFDAGTGFNGSVDTMAIQNDGKILLGGWFTTYQGVSANRIIRLNSDGSIDTTFNTVAGFDNAVNVIKTQSDGRILVGGRFTTYQGVSANRIVRLNSDGTRDTTFNIGAGFDNQVSSIAIQSDGRVLVGGWFVNYQGVSANRIVRLNSDGTRDTVFNIGTGFDSVVNVIKTQSDGRVLVGGWFESYQGVGRIGLIRLNSDGIIDNTFNIAAVTSSGGGVNAIEIQSDGKVIVAGEFSIFAGVSGRPIVRLNSDGTIDTVFRTNMNLRSLGGGSDVYTDSIGIQSNGVIAVGGDFWNNGYIAVSNTDGTAYNSLTLGTGFNDGIDNVAIQNDGKILVEGWFTTYQGVTTRLVRLNSNGSLDTSFNIGTGFNCCINDVKIQNDGKILVTGSFSTYQGVVANRVVRLNSDGSRDTTFNIAADFGGGLISDVVIQNDGKMLVTGDFSTYRGVSANDIVRLNIDGSRDTSFNSGAGFTVGAISNIVVQNDGKIVGTVGNLANYQGVVVNDIIRLNSDGSRDTSFNTGAGFTDNAVQAFTVQDDGKIVVGGQFSLYQGVAANYIARLNSDGSRDNSFNTGTGFNSFGNGGQIIQQDDGKLLIGSGFTTYQGVAANGLIRLNSDGSRDNSFDIGTGFNGSVQSISILDDGKLLIGGWFQSYQGQSAGYLTKLIP